MGFGKHRALGDFLPVLKFDALHGTFVLENRVYAHGTWERQQTDITSRFRAIFDLANAQVGWIRLASGTAPDTVLVAAGQDIGEAPSDKHREGFRILVKLDSSLGGSVREFMSTAAGVWNSLSALHDTYLAEADKHPNQLPVVTLADVVKHETGQGPVFEPKFAIAEWAPRPDDLNVEPPPSRPRPRAVIDDEIPF